MRYSHIRIEINSCAKIFHHYHNAHLIKLSFNLSGSNNFIIKGGYEKKIYPLLIFRISGHPFTHFINSSKLGVHPLAPPKMGYIIDHGLNHFTQKIFLYFLLHIS